MSLRVKSFLARFERVGYLLIFKFLSTERLLSLPPGVQVAQQPFDKLCLKLVGFSLDIDHFGNKVGTHKPPLPLHGAGRRPDVRLVQQKLLKLLSYLAVLNSPRLLESGVAI